MRRGRGQRRLTETTPLERRQAARAAPCQQQVRDRGDRSPCTPKRAGMRSPRPLFTERPRLVAPAQRRLTARTLRTDLVGFPHRSRSVRGSHGCGGSGVSAPLPAGTGWPGLACGPPDHRPAGAGRKIHDPPCTSCRKPACPEWGCRTIGHASTACALLCGVDFAGPPWTRPGS
jgi:hypothetical protein